MGAPDLVVELLSPSNTASEMFDKERLCLENGAREFWVVDTTRRTVRVATASGHPMTFQSGESIPVFFARGESIAVNPIFE